MKTHALILVGLTLGVAPLAACKPAEKVAATPVAAALQKPKPPLSVNEMMVMIVDRPGEMLWAVEKDGKKPKDAEAWYELENHAVEVEAAGTLIQLGGAGPKDAEWVAKDDWQTNAQAMIAAAQQARKAAQAKDFDALVIANGQIVEACEGCHKQYKPDIPTGGLFMHKRPG